MSLTKALNIAEEESLSEFVYDPLGIKDEKSWWWCCGVLEVLEQECLINSFEILKGPPKEQKLRHKEGVTY